MGDESYCKDKHHYTERIITRVTLIDHLMSLHDCNSIEIRDCAISVNSFLLLITSPLAVLLIAVIVCEHFIILRVKFCFRNRLEMCTLQLQNFSHDCIMNITFRKMS